MQPSSLLLPLLLLVAPCTPALDPSLAGPHTVTHTSIHPQLGGELDHHLEVYTPR